MINYTDNYFDLELLRLSELKLHEATENKRLRNIFSRIARAKFLMNPVITGRHNDDLILLDGANRYGSLKEIGCRLILAQVLNYHDKNLILDKWNHLIYDFHLNDLKKHCEVYELPFKKVSFSKGQEILDDNLNYVLAADIQYDENILIKLSHRLENIIMQLDAITKLYFRHFVFDRSESDIKFSDLRKYTRRKGTLLIFPKFRKHHIIEIANSDYRLPAGISRHRIYNRVLHVKYEIKKLMSDKNILQKQEDLKKLLNEKIDTNKVRQYQESVIVFDE
ncbi:MAG: hypothetical protein HGGPFJEG_00479 [Ignavibacteria bacterium]|nr:hypothetical protein [Ignavibacteria bacterium]